MSTVEANTLKNKVKTLASTTQTITSDFVQYKHLDFLDNDIFTIPTTQIKQTKIVLTIFDGEEIYKK